MHSHVDDGRKRQSTGGYIDGYLDSDIETFPVASSDGYTYIQVLNASWYVCPCPGQVYVTAGRAEATLAKGRASEPIDRRRELVPPRTLGTRYFEIPPGGGGAITTKSSNNNGDGSDSKKSQR